MLLMGDEYGHTRGGNNNTWCQDGKVNWFLWDELKKNHALYRFVRRMIHFRHQHSILRKESFLGGDEVIWHGKKPFDPQWEQEAALLAVTMVDKEFHEDLYVVFNATHENHEWILPDPPEGKTWHVIADTFAASPMDVFEIGQEKKVEQLHYLIHDYSSLLLKAL